jgi:hypothetical protein
MLHPSIIPQLLLNLRVLEALPNGLRIIRQKRITIGRNRRLFGKSRLTAPYTGAHLISGAPSILDCVELNSKFWHAQRISIIVVRLYFKKYSQFHYDVFITHKVFYAVLSNLGQFMFVLASKFLFLYLSHFSRFLNIFIFKSSASV